MGAGSDCHPLHCAAHLRYQGARAIAVDEQLQLFKRAVCSQTGDRQATSKLYADLMAKLVDLRVEKLLPGDKQL